MKRSLSTFAFLAIVTLGCSILTTSTKIATTQPGATEKAGVTKKAGVTEKAGATNEPTKKATLPPATNTTCNELSFNLNPFLATSIKCETVPESSTAMPFNTYPQYTKVSLVGYPLEGRMMQPVISVFPVQGYSGLLPDVVGPDVSALQALIAGGAPGDTDIPILPVQNARQLFLAQYAVDQFPNGSGVRYITQYAQAYVPINNHELFFSFQGLTSDGKYWISIIVPISHPSLWDTEGDPSNSIWTAINDNPDAYYAQIAADLNSKLPRSFVPTIVLLDALINSITITP
jgi:hypothetical protein